MPEAKPYVIPKQLVWDAYQRVKANRAIKVRAIAGVLIADDAVAINLHQAIKRLLIDRSRPCRILVGDILKLARLDHAHRPAA